MIKNTIVTVATEITELNAYYSIHELAPYQGRTGVIQMVDEDQGEALVAFYDYTNEEHAGNEPENWFPLEQLALTSFEIEMAECK